MYVAQIFCFVLNQEGHITPLILKAKAEGSLQAQGQTGLQYKSITKN